MEYKFCLKQCAMAGNSPLLFALLDVYLQVNAPLYITFSISPQNTELHCSLGPAFHRRQIQDIYSLDTTTASPLEYSLSTSPLAKLSENLLSQVSIFLFQTCNCTAQASTNE